MMLYRAYDSGWNRAGYSETPQYSGQAALTEDYPAKCHCGSPMLGCGDAEWLRFRLWRTPAWANKRMGFVAWCANDHEMKRVALV